jgi:hypothetical protein
MIIGRQINATSYNIIFNVSSFPSSVGTGFVIECMWFRENFAHAGQQSNFSGVFTAKIIQYLQIKLCTGKNVFSNRGIINRYFHYMLLNLHVLILYLLQAVKICLNNNIVLPVWLGKHKKKWKKRKKKCIKYSVKNTSKIKKYNTKIFVGTFVRFNAQTQNMRYTMSTYKYNIQAK